MVIYKDIKEIPSGCDKCELFSICKHRDVYNENHKPADCPLAEIITCKECKHCKKYADSNDYLIWCKRDSCAVSEDYYCGSGRRE